MFNKNNEFLIIAGPCAIENKEQALATAKMVKENGLTYFRGGAFKPRTSPYSFQGLGRKGLAILNEINRKFKLKIVTEITDPELLKVVSENTNIIQIGTRNMANFSLLKKVGRRTAKTRQWVILKRGFSATIEEWLLAAEYIYQAGNNRILLCERGIRTFETSTRFTIDLSAIPVIKKLSTLPILVDVSHGTGHSDLVLPMAKAAAAVGADGLMLEVHPDPHHALCDGQQSLDQKAFKETISAVKKIIELENRVVI